MKHRVAGKNLLFVLLLILLPLIAVEYYGVSGSPYSSAKVLSPEGGWFHPEGDDPTLTTDVNSGQGSVNPSCPNGCPETVNSSISVTATPSANWQFSLWSTQTGISCSSNPCTFSMPNNTVTLKATFTTPTISLSPSIALGGNLVRVYGSGFSTSDSFCTISGSGVSSQLCLMTAGSITSATFTVANVAAGYYPITVTAEPAGDLATIGFTVVTNNVASTTAASVSITIDSSPEMMDAVYVDGSAISTPETYSWQVGSVHTLTASVGSSNYGSQYDYQFEYWENEYTGSVIAYSQAYSYTVPSNSQTVVALFTTQGQGQGNTCLQYENGVCVQWQGQGNTCLQYQGNVCVQWQGNTIMTITQSKPYTRTSYATATTTTTGYATTLVSSVTLSNTLFTTQIQRSYGTDTITSYIYVESYVSSGQLANVMNVATSSGQQSPFPFSTDNISRVFNNISSVEIVAMIGAATALTASMIVRRRKHRNEKAPEKHPDKIGSGGLQSERVIDYVASHQGAISMRQATQDLGIPAEDLTGILQELKAEGRLKPT